MNGLLTNGFLKGNISPHKHQRDKPGRDVVAMVVGGSHGNQGNDCPSNEKIGALGRCVITHCREIESH